MNIPLLLWTQFANHVDIKNAVCRFKYANVCLCLCVCVRSPCVVACIAYVYLACGMLVACLLGHYILALLLYINLIPPMARLLLHILHLYFLFCFYPQIFEQIVSHTDFANFLRACSILRLLQMQRYIIMYLFVN